MKKFRYLVLAAAAYAALALVISLADMHPSKTHAASTNVSNVAVVNMPSVNVASMPTVNGIVNVANTPNVNVANMPTVGIDSLNNTVKLLRDPENPARQPFAQQWDVSFPDGASGASTPYLAVPSIKSLVIEYASVNCSLPAGQAAILNLDAITGGVSRSFYLPVTPAALAGGVSAGQQVTIYADPNTNVAATVKRTGGSTGDVAHCIIDISGHFVDP